MSKKIHLNIETNTDKINVMKTATIPHFTILLIDFNKVNNSNIRNPINNIVINLSCQIVNSILKRLDANKFILEVIQEVPSPIFDTISIKSIFPFIK